MRINPRINKLGYQMAPVALLQKISKRFTCPKISEYDQALIEQRFASLGEKFTLPPQVALYDGIDLDLPDLNLEQLEQAATQKYAVIRDKITHFLSAEIPDPPTEPVQESGWVQYSNSTYKRVSYPEGEVCVIDIETFPKFDQLPVMAACWDCCYWYLWLHPCMVSDRNPLERINIPVGSNKIIINHFVKFDSAGFAETFDLDNSNYLLDTASLHISLCGMSSTAMRNQYTSIVFGNSFYSPAWVNHTSPNSLKDCYNHHVKPLVRLTAEDKHIRDHFKNATGPAPLIPIINELIDYNFDDIKYTFELAAYLWPKYLKASPSLFSLAGHLIMNRSILPVENNFNERIHQIEQTYHKIDTEISDSLVSAIEQLLADFLSGQLTEAVISTDYYLSQLDWTPGKSGKTKGLPAWYRKIKKKLDEEGQGLKGMLPPLLLRITIRDNPVFYDKKQKWCFLCHSDETQAKPLPKNFLSYSGDYTHYSKIPHKDGLSANCGYIFGKYYIPLVDDGIISSEVAGLLNIVKKARSISYWDSIRSRVFSQNPQLSPDGSYQLIEPLLLAHGTATRRATEALWLTVSKPKHNVVGSEFRTLVTAPEGYKLLNADFDQQEMRIGALYADAYSKLIHGCTPASYIQLTGTKENGTDAHSIVANKIKVTRDNAKPVNFADAYLAGEKTQTQTLKNNCPHLSHKECLQMARAAILLSRGKKIYDRAGNFTYHGGNNSEMFNFMLGLADYNILPTQLQHLLAEDNHPRTPMLKVRMSEAIIKQHTGGDFLTSRANWGIQSSGVDLLHTFLTFFEYLCDRYSINARTIFTYHDEVWILAKDNQIEATVNAIQVAHLYTWSKFLLSLGFTDMPFNGLIFSAVNVDTIARKEVNESVITPSNSQEIAPGYTLKTP